MESSNAPTTPRKSPSKFSIYNDLEGVDVTPKASSSGARTETTSYWRQPVPPMILRTSQAPNLGQRSPVVNNSQDVKGKNDNLHAGPSDENIFRVSSLLTSLNKIDTSRPKSPSFTKQSRVVMPIGSQRPKPATKDEIKETASQLLPTPEITGIKENQNEEKTTVVEKAELSEVELLKQQLAAAQSKLAAMDQELTQQRITNESLDAVLRSPSDTQFSLGQLSRKSSGLSLPEQHSDAGSVHSSGGSGDAPLGGTSAWNASRPQQPRQSSTTFPNLFTNNTHESSAGVQDLRALRNASDGRGFNNALAPSFGPQPHRPAPLRLGSLQETQPFDNSSTASYDPWGRYAIPDHRSGSSLSFYNGGYSSYAGSMTSTPAGLSPPLGTMPGPAGMPYPTHQLGRALSPTASEFNSSVTSLTHPWAAPSVYGDNMTSSYVTPSEPMNYRRLLDRNHTCDWKYIVDKIVCSNDQQASIFLQQKLKVTPPEQKYELIDSIIGHAYPLMINRFGNFLIQRCLEHGTPEQVVDIASAIRGNVLNLSMDAFGCHVVQKALDCVPEPIKASMVHELLHRIPETVVHRYACHVWQKLFELRWNGTPPQIMKRVNEALRGMWHEVALGETGSLVVQNIFENCLEEDKRSCINEVISSIDLIAHGQFGNWCIQHICEHGLPADKSRATEHVLRYAADYSVDQFASKVVEKCLKIGGPEFMERYLERVCEGRPDRPRMPLIDIAGDQFGNYIVQFILINANPHHRELVCNHIRKHMVSLRGSKFGSRVAMLCTGPSYSARPGPASGVSFMGQQRFMSGPPMGPGMARPMQGGPYRYGN